MTSCSAGCPNRWWYIGVSESQVLQLANQNGACRIDVNSYPGCGSLCYAFILINNSNAITSRVGQMLRSATDGTTGLFLQQVGGPVLANLMDSAPFEPAALKDAFRSQMELAYKAGNYKLCTSAGRATYVDDIAIFCYAQVPFCDAGGSREYVFGTYIYNATSDTNSSNAFNTTRAELLREQLHAGLASCFNRQFLPLAERTW